MSNTAQKRAKNIWNALDEEARDVLCRINARQAISFSDDKALSDLRYMQLISMTLDPEGIPQDRLVSLTRAGELVLAVGGDQTSPS